MACDPAGYSTIKEKSFLSNCHKWQVTQWGGIMARAGIFFGGGTDFEQAWQVERLSAAIGLVPQESW